MCTHTEAGGTQETEDTVEKPNLQVIGIDAGEESKVNGIDQISHKIKAANLPKLRKDAVI